MAELIEKPLENISIKEEKGTVVRDIMDGNEAAATIAYKTNGRRKTKKIFSVRCRE